ncbi:ATP phosphoribosyltransferase [Magnetococcales bacterium HHB-1]
MSRLKVGLPKGSLEKSTYALFAQAGWNINARSRNYFPSIDDPDIECALVRPQEMGPYVGNGTLDVGLTGLDWIIERNLEKGIKETESNIIKVCDLVYSKASSQQSRWVLVVNNNSPIKTLEDLQGKTIATELVSFTKNYFAKRGIDAKVEYSWGATEAKVVEGLVDAAVELTETGSTIKAHGLRIVADLLFTHTQFIANKEALADPKKKAKIEQIALLLQASLAARQRVGLKLNAPSKRKEEILATLPSLHAPTISNMHQSDWLAIETIVDRTEVRDLIPKLVQLNAQGIIEYPLDKVVLSPDNS